MHELSWCAIYINSWHGNRNSVNRFERICLFVCLFVPQTSVLAQSSSWWASRPLCVAANVCLSATADRTLGDGMIQEYIRSRVRDHEILNTAHVRCSQHNTSTLNIGQPSFSASPMCSAYRYLSTGVTVFSKSCKYVGAWNSFVVKKHWKKC